MGEHCGVFDSTEIITDIECVAVCNLVSSRVFCSGGVCPLRSRQTGLGLYGAGSCWPRALRAFPFEGAVRAW